MSPDQKAENRDRDAGKRHEFVAENRFARKAGDDFRDDRHRRQNHDVNRGMRVEPEKMLEQNRIAAQLRVKNADGRTHRGRDALDQQQQHRNRNDGRAQNLNQARRVMRPDEKRQAEPRQAGRAHFMNRDDEVQAGQNRTETGEEDSHHNPDNVAVCIHAAIRRVKSPTGIDAAVSQCPQRQTCTRNKKIPRQQVQLGKSEVFRTDHHRHQEIAEDGGNGRDQEEKHHDRAVRSEGAIIHFRAQQTLRGEQVVTHERSRKAA